MGVGKGIYPGRVVWVHNPEPAALSAQVKKAAVTPTGAAGAQD